jgi:hypothetical protein
MTLADSNRVCAEWPKMNENPRTSVANGTSDVKAFVLSNTRSATNAMIRRATNNSTPSSLAIALLTSCSTSVGV